MPIQGLRQSNLEEQSRAGGGGAAAGRARVARLPWGMLVLSSLAGMVLLALRVFVTGTGQYLFLAFNLFLAWLPVLFALIAVSPGTPTRGRVALSIAAGALWLLFLPNSPYLLTDFLHLMPLHAPNDRPLPAWIMQISPQRHPSDWFDLLMILLFAWSGLLLGLLSIYIVHGALRQRFPRGIAWAIIGLVIVLCAFGVSLGRFERWNSWDLFRHPMALLNDALAHICNPLAQPRTLASTAVMSAFLLLAYLTMLALIRLPPDIDREEQRN